MTLLSSASERTTSAIVVATAIVLAAFIVALAVMLHARTIRSLASEQVFANVAQTVVTDDTWRDKVEQIASDVMRHPVRIGSFSSLTIDRTCRMRFVLRDGSMLEFRSAAMHLSIGGLRLLDPQRDARACGELHAVIRYFSKSDDYAGCVPRNSAWHVRLIRTRTSRTRYETDTALQRVMFW